MHRILSDRIVLDPHRPHDDGYTFRLPVAPVFDGEVCLPHCTDEQAEIQAFDRVFDDALCDGRRIHIAHVTVSHAVGRIRTLYTELGYYRDDIHTFVPDLAHCPITIGVRIESVVWSWQDRSRYDGDPTLPLRTADHVRGLIAGINQWCIAVVRIPEGTAGIGLLGRLVHAERIALPRLGNVLYDAPVAIGYRMGTTECTVQEK